jgi:hypothetical protein
LQADGGLRHVQPVSGACEAELFGDGYEIAKLASVNHVPIQSVALIKTQHFTLDLQIARIHLLVIEAGHGTRREIEGEFNEKLFPGGLAALTLNMAAAPSRKSAPC